jgi:gluconolactonase
MRMQRPLIRGLATALLFCIVAGGAARAQAPAPGPIQPWGLPPLPQGVGPVEKFADVSGTPQGQFLEGGAFDTQGNLWFVAIGSGWVSYLTPDGKLVPSFNCNPPPELGQTCEPQGTRWFEGKLYLTTRHRGILVYDPQTKEVKTLVYTYRNQLFKGPNDLDFDAEGNLFFTDPWGTGPGPNLTDQTGAVYLYSRDGMLRKVMDSGLFPNGIAVSPDDALLAVGDFRGGRIWYSTFQNGPTMGCPQCPKLQHCLPGSDVAWLAGNDACQERFG